MMDQRRWIGLLYGRQCFEVDVASECANGGNYVRGTKYF